MCTYVHLLGSRILVALGKPYLLFARKLLRNVERRTLVPWIDSRGGAGGSVLTTTYHIWEQKRGEGLKVYQLIAMGTLCTIL